MSCLAAAPLAWIFSPRNRNGFKAARAGGKEFTEAPFGVLRNIRVGLKCSLQLRMGNNELKLEQRGLKVGVGRSV